VVNDAAGNPVTGLTGDDFTVLDNGQPRPVTSFRAINGAAAPTDAQAILLVDTISNSLGSIAAEREQMEAFLGRAGGRLPLPVSIVLLADAGARIDQPTRDGNVLLAELKKTFTAIPTINAAMSGAGAIDCFQRSLRALNQLMACEGARPGRKLLLWIDLAGRSLPATTFLPRRETSTLTGKQS
jgi:VWFA-related protein